MAKRQRDGGKEQFWRRTLEQWRRGKRSVRQFCLDHGLSEPRFYSWRRELARRDQQAAVPSGSTFVPLAVRAEPAAAGEPGRSAIELVVGQRLVRVWSGFDGPTLARVLAVLEDRPC